MNNKLKEKDLTEKDTFSKRVLSEEPKYIHKKKQEVSTSINENNKKESS